MSKTRERNGVGALNIKKGGGSYETAGWVCNITSVTGGQM